MRCERKLEGRAQLGKSGSTMGLRRHPERHRKPLQGLRQWGFRIKHRQVKTCLHHTGRRQAEPTERHLPQYIHIWPCLPGG